MIKRQWQCLFYSIHELECSLVPGGPVRFKMFKPEDNVAVGNVTPQGLVSSGGLATKKPHKLWAPLNAHRTPIMY